MMNLDSISVGIFGKSGSGKSTLLKEYAKKFGAFKKIVCISPVEDLPNSQEIWYESDISLAMQNQDKKTLHRKNIMVRSTNHDSMDLIINCAELGRNWLILIDEIFQYQTDRLREISQVRRHSKTSLVYTERRPAMVDKRFVNESDILVSFRQREPNTLKYLSEFMHHDQLDIKSTLQSLEDYHYYVYSSNQAINGKTFKTKV
jgi:uridine kinase